MRILAVAVVLVAAPARAEDERLPDRIVPTALTIQLSGATARLVARYPVPVGKQTFARSAVDLEVPVGALATGATVIEGSARHRLSLDPAEQASAKMDALAKRAPGPRRAAAVELSAVARGTVMFGVAAPEAEPLAIDLELAEPTCFDDDMRYVAIPDEWLPLVAHAYHAVDHREGVEIADHCHDFTDSAWVAFPTNELARRPEGDARIGITASRLSVSQGDLAHVVIDIAHELSEVPRDLRTVILVDGSRSVDPSEADAQRAIVESYLQHVPGTLVQVLAYARTPRPLLPAWTNATAAATRVERELRALAGRNGSNVDTALAAAGALLAGTPGARRILLFTDGRLARRLSEVESTKLKRFVPPGTVVHVIALAPESGDVARSEAVVLAALATATDGIAVSGRSQDGKADATMLARPISFDDLELTAPGWTTSDEIEPSCTFDAAVSLDEGRSCEWWGVGDAVSGPVTIEGLVWGRRVVRTLQPDPSRGRDLARALISIHELENDDLRHEVEVAAYAVDGAWSLFGLWGGTDGYSDQLPKVGYGEGRSATDFRGGGTNDFASTSVGMTTRIDLHDQISAAIASCHPGARNVNGSIELTREEIVDVEVRVAGEARSKEYRALSKCVEDALWSMMVALPGAPEWSDAIIAYGPTSR